MATSIPTLAQLFIEHAGFVWSLLRRLGVPVTDVEDVSQEVTSEQLDRFNAAFTGSPVSEGIAPAAPLDAEVVLIRGRRVDNSPDLFSRKNLLMVEVARVPLVLDR